MEVPKQEEHEKIDKRISITVSQGEDLEETKKETTNNSRKSFDIRSSTESTTSAVSVARDLYGFEVRKHVVEAYNNHMNGDFMERLQQQKENFDKFMIAFEPISKKDDMLDAQSFAKNYPQLWEQLEVLVKKGIPPKYRALFWGFFSGTTQIAKMSTGIYKAIYEDNKGKYSDSIRQLDKDIKRTFSTATAKFDKEALYQILYAYSFKNPEQGYVQSMNFLAAGILMFLPEEESFWMLGWLVEKFMASYYDKTLTGFEIDARILTYYVKRRLPKLYKHFKKVNFNVRTVCMQWFMCLYLTSLPSECAFRIWDKAFMLGHQILYEVALGIFKITEQEILSKEMDTEIGAFLNQEVARMFDVDKLFDVKPIKPNKLAKVRQKIKVEVDEDLQQFRDNQIINSLVRTTHFNEEELRRMQSEFFEIVKKKKLLGINLEVFVGVLKVVYSDIKWDSNNLFVKRLFMSFDELGSSNLNFEGLAMGLSTFCKGTFEEKKNLCCKVFGHQGVIVKEELRKILKALYELFYQKDFEGEVDVFVDLMFKHDVNGDGMLTFDEFKNAVPMQPIIVKAFHMETKENKKLSKSFSITT